jgi:hypothetical protein
LLGEPSNGLVDVDLDWPEARIAARYILPATRTSGRESCPDSHRWYYADPLPAKTKRYKLPGDGDDNCVVELRSTGAQTLVAPSRHPDGDRYIWGDGEVGRVDGRELDESVADVATAALVARRCPGQGARHDYWLHATGFIGRRLPRKRAERTMEAAIAASGDEEARARLRDVADTLDKLERGEPVTGGPALEALAPGILDQLRSWRGWIGAQDEDCLPRIVVNNRHLRDVTEEAIAALDARNNPPEIFVRAGRLVRVREDEKGIPEIQAMEDSHVKGRLARVADFVRTTEKGETTVNPPDWTVKDIQALEAWPFPALEAIVEAPIMRPDGTILDVPGYDPQTRLYYRPAAGLDVPRIPAVPTKADIRAAITLLDEAVGEFPYEDGSSAANTLGLMLTPVVRQAIDGPVPMALIDKPQAGTGGSLLAEAVAVIASGRTAEMLGSPRDDEEWGKRITAKLAAGATMMCVDNVEGPLYAPSLARALTARTWTDRVLGRSEVVTVPQHATWIATGNNIQLRGDLPRRCYWIRLDAREARPWQRQGFKHPDLLDWVSKNRGRLIHALLTVARAWFAGGKPKATDLPRLGSFEAWTETVGGMVKVAGIPGFLGNLAALYDKADEGNAEWEGFLLAWWEEVEGQPVTVAELVKLIKEKDKLRSALPPDLAEALDKSEGSVSRKLGNALAKRAGTRYGEDALHVVRAGEFRRAVRWQLQKGPSECEFVSFVSLYNPSAENFQRGTGPIREEKKVEGAETNSTNSQTHTDRGGRGLTEEDNPNERLWRERQAKRAETEWLTGSETRSGRRLRDEEMPEYRRLVAEGKTPGEARAIVLAKLGEDGEGTA